MLAVLDHLCLLCSKFPADCPRSDAVGTEPLQYQKYFPSDIGIYTGSNPALGVPFYWFSAWGKFTVAVRDVSFLRISFHALSNISKHKYDHQFFLGDSVEISSLASNSFGKTTAGQNTACSSGNIHSSLALPVVVGLLAFAFPAQSRLENFRIVV